MRRSVAIIGTRGYPSYYGGFETAVRRLAPYLAERNWDVTVYGRPGTTKPNDPQRDPRVQSVVTRGIESRSLSTLTFGLTASAAAAASRPSVALVMNVANGFYLPLLKARGVATLVNVDGIEWDREKWGRGAKAMFRAGARMTARFADQLVFDAHAIGDRWRSEFHRDGIFIPYGGEAKQPTDPPLDLESGKYILVVARFVPENSVPLFLEAAKELSNRHQIVIVGSSGYGGALDDEAAWLQQNRTGVRWLGHVSDDDLLFSLLEHAGAYFHGHSVGGTNPALVQAMACGAPVVARDTVYNREVLGPRGQFVQPNVRAIVRSLDEMMSSKALRDEARSNAQQRSAEEYTWDLVCSRYEAELERLSDARTF